MSSFFFFIISVFHRGHMTVSSNNNGDLLSVVSNSFMKEADKQGVMRRTASNKCGTRYFT